MKSLGEEFKERKNELGITTEQLSRLSGIPTGTINKILNGETKSPRYATLKALNDVLFRDIDSGIDGIRETAAAYTVSSDKKQGEYTLNDYYAHRRASDFSGSAPLCTSGTYQRTINGHRFLYSQK